jgi:hypothetical protein
MATAHDGRPPWRSEIDRRVGGWRMLAPKARVEIENPGLLTFGIRFL